ncbi:24454_t:CDS:2 [Gigaspora margarita]|uniref:24454_t:CDS:1 n=1 Tax=Gigaspora margarita TaxID=4874 RepID=A0ABN7V3C0_GIGMA|nr:24454_t:CDS:2 [Gigaspora margarita]
MVVALPNHDLANSSRIFLLDNSIFRIRINNSKDPNDGSDELDLSYWTNCKKEESRLPSIHVEEHKDEKCVYINGILNSSYGIIWDTVETIVSRSFDDETIPVYTFANIYREFINPKGLIRCIEHNANEEDLIAKIGVLSEINNPRFHGKIFIYKNAMCHRFHRYHSLNPDDYVICKRPVKCIFSEWEKVKCSEAHISILINHSKILF